MALISKEQSVMFTEALLTFALTELVESFNIGKTMNQMQIVFTVNGIKSDYYFLKIEELKYCFENAKKGRYGTMYDRIDSAVIFEWIEKYLAEKMEIVYDENINQNSQYNSMVLHENVVNEIKKAVKPIAKVNMDLITPVKRELTEHEALCQDILREFDKLHREKPYDPTESIRTIPYLNKNITQTQFLEIRLEELNKI